MTIRYDTDAGSFAFLPAKCQDCGGPLYDTGCEARGCDARLCPECGTGCDIEIEPDTGRCATALAEESDEDYTARINGERAAFGLSPVVGSPGLNCQSCGMLPDQQHDEGCPEGDPGGPVWPG